MSCFTLDLEYEKQVDLLLADDEEEEEKEINEAKMNYETENNSNWSATSILMMNNLLGTIPEINNKNAVQQVENEDRTSTNTNVTSTTAIFNNPSSSPIQKQKNIDNHLRKFSISSLNDKLFDNFSVLSNNNVNKSTTNINNQTNIVADYRGIQNMDNTFFNNYNMNNCNMTYDFYPRSNGFGLSNNKMNNNNNLIFQNQIKNNNNNFAGNMFNNSNNMHHNNFYMNNNSINTINSMNTIKSNNTINSNNPMNKNNNINNYNNMNFYNNQIKMAKTQTKKFKSSFYQNSKDNSNNPINCNINNMNCNINSNNGNINNIKNNNFNNYNQIPINNNYLNNKSKNKTDSMLLMIKDPIGNKKIQKKIEEKSPKFLYELYQQIKKNLYEIMNDQYGNYVIQKFVRCCDKKILSSILKHLFEKNKHALYEISMNPHGTRALQKLIKHIAISLNDEDIYILKKSLEGNITSMVKDINGNHVIQIIIENVKSEDLLSFIYKEMNDNLLECLCTKSGSCVFSRIIKCDIASEGVINMIDNILKNIGNYINNEFGNFAVQKIIELNDSEYNDKIYEYIQDKIVSLSSQKFASNVIEKCILADNQLRQKIINKLIEGKNIIELIIDKYGNYIVQKALEVIGQNEKEFYIIINKIKESYKNLRQSEHGKKIYDKLVKNYRSYLEPNKEKINMKVKATSSKNKKENVSEGSSKTQLVMSDK